MVPFCTSQRHLPNGTPVVEAWEVDLPRSESVSLQARNRFFATCIIPRSHGSVDQKRKRRLLEKNRKAGRESLLPPA